MPLALASRDNANSDCLVLTLKRRCSQKAAEHSRRAHWRLKQHCSHIKVPPEVIPVVLLVQPPLIRPHWDDGIGVELGVAGVVVRLDVVDVHRVGHPCDMPDTQSARGVSLQSLSAS